MLLNSFKLSSKILIITILLVILYPKQLQYITEKPPLVIHNVKFDITGEIPLKPSKPKTVVKQFPSVPLPVGLKKYIRQCSKQFGVEESLVYAVMWKESRFSHNAVSRGGNYLGLGQISRQYMYKFASRVGIKNFNPFNPYHNAKVTISQLSSHKKYWQSKGYSGIRLKVAMLNSYNMGTGGFSKHISRGGSLNRSYSRTIINYQNKLSR